MKIKTLLFGCLLTLACSIASADIVGIELGNATSGLSGNATDSLGNEANDGNGGQVITETSAYLIDDMPSGVSFRITLSNFGDGNFPNAQNVGTGVNGGRANSGIDNNSNNTGGSNPDGDYSEALQLTISDVVGGTVVFEAFKLNFTEDVPDEKVIVNGAAFEDATLSFRSVAGEGTGWVLTLRAPSQNVYNADSRYVIDEVQFNITAAIPEPTSAAVFGVLGLSLFVRRKK